MKNFKFHTAIFICTAFMFRIVCFNICTIPYLNLSPTTGIVKTHFSTAMKRKVSFEMAEISENAEYSSAEFCEEKENNEKSRLESNPFSLIQTLYSLVTSSITTRLKGLTPFCNYLSYSCSHRYLILQVFRT